MSVQSLRATSLTVHEHPHFTFTSTNALSSTGHNNRSIDQPLLPPLSPRRRHPEDPPAYHNSGYPTINTSAGSPSPTRPSVAFAARPPTREGQETPTSSTFSRKIRRWASASTLSLTRGDGHVKDHAATDAASFTAYSVVEQDRFRDTWKHRHPDSPVSPTADGSGRFRIGQNGALRSLSCLICIPFPHSRGSERTHAKYTFGPVKSETLPALAELKDASTEMSFWASSPTGFSMPSQPLKSFRQRKSSVSQSASFALPTAGRRSNSVTSLMPPLPSNRPSQSSLQETQEEFEDVTRHSETQGEPPTQETQDVPPNQAPPPEVQELRSASTAVADKYTSMGQFYAIPPPISIPPAQHSADPILASRAARPSIDTVLPSYDNHHQSRLASDPPSQRASELVNVPTSPVRHVISALRSRSRSRTRRSTPAAPMSPPPPPLPMDSAPSRGGRFRPLPRVPSRGRGRSQTDEERLLAKARAEQERNGIFVQQQQQQTAESVQEVHAPQLMVALGMPFTPFSPEMHDEWEMGGGNSEDERALPDTPYPYTARNSVNSAPWRTSVPVPPTPSSSRQARKSTASTKSRLARASASNVQAGPSSRPTSRQLRASASSASIYAMTQ